MLNFKNKGERLGKQELLIFCDSGEWVIHNYEKEISSILDIEKVLEFSNFKDFSDYFYAENKYLIEKRFMSLKEQEKLFNEVFRMDKIFLGIKVFFENEIKSEIKSLNEYFTLLIEEVKIRFTISSNILKD